MKLLSRIKGRPYKRSKSNVLRYAIEELKFIKSFKDLRIFFRKVEFVLPRLTGRLDKYQTGPPALQIEPTNHCNVTCICCPSLRSSRSRGYMDIKLFRKIIDDAARIGVMRIHLFLHGEPLLHPHIVEMISYIKSKKLGILISTNGMPFNKEKIKAILSSGVNNADHFSFSIFGHSKEVHETVMKRSNFDRIVKNILTFLALRRKMKWNGPVIETNFYILPENAHEEEKYVNKWRKYVDHVRVSGVISESFSKYKQKRNNIQLRTQTCLHLWQIMTVFWNGDVTVCCQDVDGDWILGNLNEQSIREIWNNKRLLVIKKIHKEKLFEKLPFCHKCDM